MWQSTGGNDGCKICIQIGLPDFLNNSGQSQLLSYRRLLSQELTLICQQLESVKATNTPPNKQFGRMVKTL